MRDDVLYTRALNRAVGCICVVAIESDYNTTIISAFLSQPGMSLRSSSQLKIFAIKRWYLFIRFPRLSA